jgi:hypothetical protein
MIQITTERIKEKDKLRFSARDLANPEFTVSDRLDREDLESIAKCILDMLDDPLYEKIQGLSYTTK